MIKLVLIILVVFLQNAIAIAQAISERGEVTTFNQKFVWSVSGDAFVPNYIMIDMIAIQRDGVKSNDLSLINEKDIDDFISEFIVEHGFNGIHVPVYGQWFHIGDNKVKPSDIEIDQRTFDKLAMIINKVYNAGGCTHIWLWGDDSRNWTSKSLKHGIMGKEERYLLDEIYKQLSPLRGWTMGYGFDLWEWIGEQQLKEWHKYLWSKENWNHLLGARASKNKLDQLYEGLDYSGYEYHKPWYPELVSMISIRPDKPSFSEDRYRIRTASKWPEKDYSEDETRRGLWHHTMAGGIAAIWGNLQTKIEYNNKHAIKCFFVFWNDNKRFKKDMVRDTTLSTAYCLTNYSQYVFYQENTENIEYSFSGNTRRVIAVDTKKAYEEIDLGKKKGRRQIFKAPYCSDWAIWVE
ncbi:MAG: hypothetical protein GXO81_13630 [Chlorobi bacterium]|nr:hypothetical protein [Chlorobiota bacterium]